MSRAFTREDDLSNSPEVIVPVSALPPGTANLMTPAGRDRLRAELARLTKDERPALAAAAQDADGKRELARLDGRIRNLRQSLATAEVVEPRAFDRVQFGSRVTVREAQGTETSYRLVGLDEADFSRNEVSWLSPLAQALMGARVGETVTAEFPSGPTVLVVVAIE